jgi:ElaB/YqjD/DUF883 family membrane-anchored ribosome-binding protein
MSKLSKNLKDNAARLKENAHDLSGKAGERLSAAKDSARELAGTAKERGGELVTSGREKVSHGVDVTREKANAAAEKGKETFDNNPLAVVAGGLVLGAIIAALLPTSERERSKLGGAGSKLKDKVKTAASAAKETAASKMEDSGLNADALKGQFGDLIGKGLDILKEAGKAAGDAAKK